MEKLIKNTELIENNNEELENELDGIETIYD
jgi:hypothetical protein